jgi:pimeloyl-ACP methyl ester carboxylesterase
VKSLLFAACLLCQSIAFGATEIPPGKWSFEFVDKRGHPDRPMRVYTYRPKSCDEKCPIQFVLHGAQRNASDYRDWWELDADRYNLVIVAPQFSQRHWKGGPGYNLGDVERQDDPEKWAFAAIEHLFDELRAGRTDYRIFGHSAGAQFLLRMMVFRPENRASLAVAANPGWYTMPEWRSDRKADPFPYSLVGARVGERELRRALQRRVVLMVGEKDNDPDDEILAKYDNDIRRKQGAGRRDRGENFFKAVTAAANELGVKLAWEFMEIPETAHEPPKMGRWAAEIMYGKR